MERDALPSLVRLSSFDFNSHAHVERDLFEFNIFRVSLYFNSHAHVERDAVHMSPMT